mmetsp:Transcript_5653/g.7224  ORF Transcript_5653/g.7224 Transcript_5653/m.7224 type:complete len:156 (+) Transcript_5653:1-468(+)
MNISAYGQRINHPPPMQQPNVDVVSFMWEDVLKHNNSFNRSTHGDKNTFFPLPNRVRNDGSPWYLEPWTGEIVSFPIEEYRNYDCSATVREWEQSLLWHNEDQPSKNIVPSFPAGACFYASSSIGAEQELFFDYKLRGPPYPSWARKWYSPAAER